MVGSEILRFIFGFKLRHFRLAKEISSKDLAQKIGMSASYLNEIEKGKKYPKADKILELAKALDISYDDLVSMSLGQELKHLANFLDSTVMKEFPFQMFGIPPREVLELVTNAPKKAGALLATVLEIARSYDMGVEHFYLASLRSYQEIHQNYFEEIEEKADQFLENRDWKSKHNTDPEALKTILTEEYGVQVKEICFDEDAPELKGLRSAWIKGKKPKLLVNQKLYPSQKAFEYGREIGFRCLEIKAKHRKATSSSWQESQSFDQVLSHFQASYFSGAILLKRDLLIEDLKEIFQNKQWNGDQFLVLLEKYQSTGEMFLYRLSEIIPKFFGLNIHYHRFTHEVGTDIYNLNKHLSMSELMMPHGIALHEKFCRRWLSVHLLQDLDRAQSEGQSVQAKIGVQRSHYLDKDAEYFCITIARPLSLFSGKNTSITLGFLINDIFKEKVQFWDDPNIPTDTISGTCERCRLSYEECDLRANPPFIYEQEQHKLNREQLLSNLIEREKKE